MWEEGRGTDGQGVLGKEKVLVPLHLDIAPFLSRNDRNYRNEDRNDRSEDRDDRNDRRDGSSRWNRRLLPQFH